MKNRPKITTVEQIRQQVQRIEPDLPPFALNSKALDDLYKHVTRTGDPKALMHLRQQACLANAMQALHEGWDLDYLYELN
jgi:hypothetical protein